MKKHALLWLALAACNPVIDDAIDAVPANAPGVRDGPLHHPGQACLLCHDGDFGDPSQFTVAGTVFEDPLNLSGADGVTVTMTDATGSMHEATTNTAGNFYVTPDQWSPTFPLHVSLSNGLVMSSEVGRNGACAFCHVSPASPSSPGPVVLELADGGTPP